MKEQCHIALEVPEGVPDYILTELLKEIDNEGLTVHGVKRPVMPWMGLEWAIPGLITAYILKPYFDGFLQEMGKDHYEKLKKWLQTLLLTSRQFQPRTITVGEHKIDPSNTQSKAISIFIELKNGQQLKLLFDSELTARDWLDSLEEIMEMIIANYEGRSNDPLAKELTALRGIPYFTVYAYINKATKKWEFIDDLMSSARK